MRLNRLMEWKKSTRVSARAAARQIMLTRCARPPSNNPSPRRLASTSACCGLNSQRFPTPCLVCRIELWIIELKIMRQKLSLEMPTPSKTPRKASRAIALKTGKLQRIKRLSVSMKINLLNSPNKTTTCS